MIVMKLNCALSVLNILNVMNANLILGCVAKKSEPAAAINPVVSTEQNLPTCTQARISTMMYVQSSQQFFVCDSSQWRRVESSTSGTGGAGGTGSSSSTATTPGATAANSTVNSAVNSAASSSAVGGYILSKTAISPGDECRYGGTRAEGGLDANKNGVLESTEVTSSFPVCDGTIEQIGKDAFRKYVYSIGLVVAKTNDLINGAQMSGGTGWVVGDGLVLTNGHVASMDSGVLTSGYEIWVYFPKTQYAADTILAKGLPNYAGFTPSDKDFDAYKVSAVDLTPYTTTTSDSADLAFLTVPGISGRAALPLADAVVSSSAGAATDLTDPAAKNFLNLGDGVFNINYSQVQGPRLSLGTVTTIQTCGAWLKTTTSQCTTELRVPDNRRLLFWWGYGDHGGSGSPVFDRFGKVAGIFTFGSAPPDTFTAVAQLVGDIQYWLSKPRAWKSM